MERQFNCARCGKALTKNEAHMGQPFITASELARTAMKNPATLFGPALPEVAYCEECRQIIAKQRPREQLKVLLGIIMFLALILVVVILIVP